MGWPCYEGPERTPVFTPSRFKRGEPQQDHVQELPEHLAKRGTYDRLHSHSKRAENQASPDWDSSVCDGYWAGKTSGFVGITDEVTQANPIGDNVYAWKHDGQSSAIVAGPFTPKSWGTTYGDCIVVGDFVQNWVKCVKWDFTKNQPAGWKPAQGWQSSTVHHLLEGSGDAVGFRMGPDGNLWILGHCIDCNGYGILRRLIPPNGNTSLPYGVDRAVAEIAAGAAANNGNTGTPTYETGAACYPPDGQKINLSPLPKGWESIMYAQSFAGSVQYARNGHDGTKNAGGPIEIDASVGGADKWDGSTLSVSGIWFPRGFGTKATSEIHLKLDGNCYRFKTSVGIDDSAGIRYSDAVENRKALGEFVIKADGVTVRNLTQLPAGQPAQVVDVSELQEVTDLGLYGWRPWGNTMPMGDPSLSFLNWADPKVYCGPDAPYMPIVKITFPTAKNAFSVGDNVVFEGKAMDYNMTPLPETSYSWYINLIHCQGAKCHVGSA